MKQGTLKQQALDYITGFFTPIAVTTGEVALRVGAPQASARRILGELCAAGLIVRDGIQGAETTWKKSTTVVRSIINGEIVSHSVVDGQ